MMWINGVCEPKHANMKRIRSVFAYIRFEANNKKLRIRHTLSTTRSMAALDKISWLLNLKTCRQYAQYVHKGGGGTNPDVDYSGFPHPKKTRNNSSCDRTVFPSCKQALAACAHCTLKSISVLIRNVFSLLQVCTRRRTGHSRRPSDLTRGQSCSWSGYKFSFSIYSFFIIIHSCGQSVPYPVGTILFSLSHILVVLIIEKRC